MVWNTLIIALSSITMALQHTTNVHAQQVPITAPQLPVTTTHSTPSSSTFMRKSTSSSKQFKLREGDGVYSPKDMLETVRPRAGVANSAGDLLFVPVTKYSFDKKETTKNVHIFSLEAELPSVTIDGLDVLWLDDRTLLRVTEKDGVQTLETISISLSKHELTTSSPQSIGKLPPSSSASNFVYSSQAGLLVFSAAVYEDYDLETIKKQDEEYEGRGTSAYVFDETFVRHWDTWRGPKKNRLFTVELEKSDEGWKFGSEFYRPLFNTTHYTPVEPFGGTDDFSISSTHILYTVKDPSLPEAMHTRQNVYLIPITGLKNPEKDEPKHLTSGKQGATHSPQLSHKGDKAVWLELALDGYESDRAQIVVYDLEKDVRFYVARDWDRSPGEITWSEDDSHLVLTAGDLGHVKVWMVKVPPTPSSSAKDKDDTSTPLALTEQHTASSPQHLPSGRLLYSVSSLSSPLNIKLISGLNTPSQPLTFRAITSFGKEEIDETEKVLDKGEEFWFEGAKGQQVHGFVVRPPGWDQAENVKRGKKWPAVLLIHGGPQSAWEDSWSTRWNPNVFAQQGYYTIFINPAGSTTYGQNFTDAITADWGGRPFVDLKLGWKYVLKTYPQIDPERLVAAGASWGGYAINWIQGHDEYDFEFKALVCHDGVFDTTYNGFSTDELYFFNHDFAGPPWTGKTAERFNPSRFVHKWKTPQMLIHGGKDYRLAETESIGAFHALQQRGVPSRFLYFPDENHWVLKPENSLKWHYEVFRWFDEFVGDA